MDAFGILSIIFGIIGILASYWYIGIVLCAIGLVLGIIGAIENGMDSTNPVVGFLLSVLGIIASVFFIVSDLDSGALVLNTGKFGGNMVSNEKKNDKKEQEPYLTYDTDTEVSQNADSRTPKIEEKSEEQRIDQQEEKQAVVSALFKDENLAITYIGISENELYKGYDINFEVENFSNRTITVQVRETSINGYMVNPTCSIDVSPGKKSIDKMLIMGSDSERTPIGSINSIETKFHIFDYDDNGFGYDTENIRIK